jgi:hypothetical protein
MILEKGCAERGCACYDVRVDEGVEVKVVRELTDEEIRKVADEVFKNYKNWHYYQIDFARAILKRASERAEKSNYVQY